MKPAFWLPIHLGLAAFCWVSFVGSVQGQVTTLLHDFGDGTTLPAGTSSNHDGTSPTTSLIQGRDGNFYGTTFNGGLSGNGTVFVLMPQGVVTILHNFGDGNVTNDGLHPRAALIQGSGIDTNFYGTTSTGGTNGMGVIFTITPQGTVTILHNFGDSTVLDTLGNAATDGVSPAAALTPGTDGKFYGVTLSGGSNTTGVAFSMTPQGIVTILHNFGDGTVSNDGLNPTSALIQGSGSDTAFYGTTPGGGANNRGTVFKMTLQGAVTILHSFGGSAVQLDGGTAIDGTFPIAGLIQGSDGNFYGTTSNGGANNTGTVFQMTPQGAVTILHSFGGATDGTFPVGGLTQGSDGALYGTTSGGGSRGNGTAFKVTLQGVETLLHHFGDGTAINPDHSIAMDGTIPAAGLTLGSDGNFYGAATGGGTGPSINSSPLPDGTLFKIALAPPPPPPETFGSWKASYNITGGAADTPQNDGVPNLLKYFLDINPTVPLSSADRSALPAETVVTNGGVTYLTLTYRQHTATTDLTVKVQTSFDLLTWATIDPPDLLQQTGTDNQTGDPIMQIGVKTNGSGKQFIRLDVISP